MIDLTGFLHRATRTFNRIGSDLLQLKNIDAYVITFLAVILTVLSALGSSAVSDDLRWSIVLAALGFLVFRITTPEQKSSKLDDFLNDRTNLGSFPDRLKNAQTLWIYAPSAANLLRGDNIEAIRKTVLGQENGEFRVIIQNPDQAEAVNILVEQLDHSLDFKMQDLPVEISGSITLFNKIKSTWKHKGKFDYKLLDYSPGFSLVIVDADKKSGVIIVEMHGFYNESTGSRMNIEITREKSEVWYSYWRSQFEQMWNKASSPDKPSA